MGVISFRTYLLVGIVFGLIILAVGVLAGEDVYEWADEQDAKAAAAGVEWAGTLIMEPLKFAVNPDQVPFGAIIAALFWPVTIFWPLLVLMHILLVEGMGVADDTSIDISMQWFQIMLL